MANLCKNCRFWRPSPHAPRPGEFGVCHAYPQSALAEPTLTEAETHACKEHKRAVGRPRREEPTP